MRARLGTAVLVLGLAAASACGKKKSHETKQPSPEVTGLAAVPATAQVVIAADVAKLTDSPIVARAVEQLLLREPSLAESWAHVQDSCKLDLRKQVDHIMLALGPPQAGAGSGPVLMVATGSVSEPDLASCIRTMVGKGGGALTATTVGGRQLYQVKDGNRTMFFAFGRPDTVVLGTTEAWVLDGLGTGKKALDNPDMKGWLAQVDQHAPAWAVGRVDERVRAGMVSVTGSKLTQGPVAILASINPTSGMKLDLGVLMATAEDAKTLESFANNELKLLVMAAQIKALGPVVAKVAITSEATKVRFTAALTMDEVNQLLSVLDEAPSPEQVTPPPSGSGAGSSAPPGSGNSP